MINRIITPFILFLLVGCHSAPNKILGLKCFNEPKDQEFKKLDQSTHQYYKRLKDSIYHLPHLPLHKHLHSRDIQTFIGLGYQKPFENIHDSIKNNPYVVSSRQDSIGYHYMLKTQGRSAYLMLTNTPKYPLLFINTSNSEQRLTKLFGNEAYYSKKFACN